MSLVNNFFMPNQKNMSFFSGLINDWLFNQHDFFHFIIKEFLNKPLYSRRLLDNKITLSYCNNIIQSKIKLFLKMLL